MPRQSPSTPQPSATQWFSVRLQPSTGLTSQQEEAFDRLLAEYLAAREMTADGTQLRMQIQSVERELGVHDQADLVCWIMDQPAIAAIHFSVIGATTARATRRWATASRSDRAVEPLVQLYRMGRIGAASYFEALFSIRPDLAELEANT